MKAEKLDFSESYVLLNWLHEDNPDLVDSMEMAMHLRYPEPSNRIWLKRLLSTNGRYQGYAAEKLNQIYMENPKLAASDHDYISSVQQFLQPNKRKSTSTETTRSVGGTNQWDGLSSEKEYREYSKPSPSKTEDQLFYYAHDDGEPYNWYWPAIYWARNADWFCPTQLGENTKQAIMDSVRSSVKKWEGLTPLLAARRYREYLHMLNLTGDENYYTNLLQIAFQVKIPVLNLQPWEKKVMDALGFNTQGSISLLTEKLHSL